jgi:hypothetical protein
MSASIINFPTRRPKTSPAALPQETTQTDQFKADMVWILSEVCDILAKVETRPGYHRSRQDEALRYLNHFVGIFDKRREVTCHV